MVVFQLYRFWALNEAIFMATTDENIVWSIELDADGNEGVNVAESQ